MKRSKKWLAIIVILLALPLPIYALLTTKLLRQQLHIVLPKNNDVIDWYVLVAGSVIILYLVISLLTILFWPTRRKFNLLRKKNGSLTVTSKAINNFIYSSLSAEPFLSDAKVKSRLTKHAIRIKISGNLLNGSDAKDIFDQYLKQLATNLRQLLGIKQKPKIEIKFANYQSKSAKRVQ
ncbi:alkaline shock response membrane anchor protein AmaP [Bombilactobacillus thymidiniphilus]|uniref:Alkaline shock response membrane anchor protein AmaP n=1 Tax=Bombilactobacillus thymidiniphilus TaxID=2923363 RepID=A0ABY4PES5_9LACO|nr:alkaline shock response membrane anchor protein AmaP [Bombilactobacillus thymidiniphilus]UQS84251.1 alkaline shock response membrane anchor protein AmaP [Bombilactobacillus thymidiniphilus]